MITGIVNPRREPVIRLAVMDAAGISHEFDAIVDTGFNGSLTLPPAMIAALGLQFRGRSSSILADGSVDECDDYAGVVDWDGQHRGILIEEADTEPLVGMLLMYGSELLVKIIYGGDVLITRMP